MAKFYDKRTLNHEQAVAWVKQQIIGMGFAFNEIHLEAGIDGFVELADPRTGAAQANFLGVQVKTCEMFAAESAETFSFYADGDDITYWRASSVPVLLIVCRAKTDEAYAIWIRDYFNAPQNAATKTVAYNKERDRFRGSDNWQRRLVEAGVPHGLGMSFPPVPKPEELSSNLLEAIIPKTVYQGRAKLKNRPEVLAELNRQNCAAHEFIIKKDLVWTVHSLYDAAWSGVVENLSIKPTAFAELAFQEDSSKRRYAVELLNLCLSARLWRDEIFWFDKEDMYVYAPKRSVTKRVRKSVKTEKSETRRGLIFPTFFNGRLVRCRHLAMVANFVEIGGTYYLQIDPTYFFSRDGKWKHPRAEELIRTVRILQKQRDYHSNLEVWRELLTQPADLARLDYPFLSFSEYRGFTSPVSIPDSAWKTASTPNAVALPDLDEELSLFVQ
jgi:hypothetical protein